MAVALLRGKNNDFKLPEEILKPEYSTKFLNHWLMCPRLKTKTKKYFPKTLYSLLCEILRHMRCENPHYPNCFKTKPDLNILHRSIDNIFLKLRDEKVGTDSWTTGATWEKENLLLDKGILNTTTLKGLF